MNKIHLQKLKLVQIQTYQNKCIVILRFINNILNLTKMYVELETHRNKTKTISPVFERWASNLQRLRKLYSDYPKPGIFLVWLLVKLSKNFLTKHIYMVDKC